ncbi:MAG: hypothetical protein H8E55_00660 [Pelagibacterales bacterium]|nr:hypothetical protein [Pelagibacterales bacterium]
MIKLKAKNLIIKYELEKNMIPENGVSQHKEMIKNNEEFIKKMEDAMKNKYKKGDIDQWTLNKQYGDPKVRIQEQAKLIAQQRQKGLIYGGKKKSKYNKRMTKKLMCPKNCCGLPVLKCNCPKSCGHCNCQEIKRLRRLLRKKTRKRKKHRKRNTKKRRKKRTKRRR